MRHSATSERLNGILASGYARYSKDRKQGQDGLSCATHIGPAIQSAKALELTSAFITAAREQGARFDVSSAVHESDCLLAFIVARTSRLGIAAPPRAIAEYFESGSADASHVESLRRQLGLGPQCRILEFAAGFGRVTRHLTHLDLTASDIHARAVTFLQHSIGVMAFPSAIEPLRMESPSARFDFIFVLSLFSHLPDRLFGPWLSRLSNMLAPGGFLMFTMHGAAAGRKTKILGNALNPETGFGYIPDLTDQTDISPEIYGCSIASEAYVAHCVHRFTNMSVYSFSPAAWWDLQDEWILRAPA
jgi:SAM-dependent methyltransferase